MDKLISKLQGKDQYIDNIQFERDFTEEERKLLVIGMELIKILSDILKV